MTTLTLKIEPMLKERSQEKAKATGLSLSAAIKAFLSQWVDDRLDVGIQPRYHSRPEPGDTVFHNWDDAIAYFEKELKKKKNKSLNHGNKTSKEL